MNGVVRFTREKNRTAEDVFKNMILPKIPLALNVICQKIAYYNRHNHTYENRTGACENSISWIPAEVQGARVRAAIVAGGPSKALYEYVQTVVIYHDEQGRIRAFEPKNPKVINKGDPIYVDYAVFLERKGFPVLKQGIEHFRPQLAAMVGTELKQENLPRLYTFKYTGETADLWGGQ
jgi:hypothetical protein